MWTQSEPSIPVWVTALDNIVSSKLQISIFKNKTGIFPSKLHLKWNHSSFLWDGNASVSSSKTIHNNTDIVHFSLKALIRPSTIQIFNSFDITYSVRISTLRQSRYMLSALEIFLRITVDNLMIQASLKDRGAGQNHLMQLMPGCVVRRSPISEPFPVTAHTKPLGKPAIWRQCIMCKHETAPCNKNKPCQGQDWYKASKTP